jgi:phospholipase D1/2
MTGLPGQNGAARLAAVPSSEHTAPLRAAARNGGPGMAVGTIIRIAVVAVTVLLVALIWGFTPLSRFANPEAVAGAMKDVAASRWQFAIVLGCFLAAGIVVFPMLLLIMACAAVFGPGLGFVYSSVGLLASAALNYALGLWLGREMLKKVLGRRFEATRSSLLRRGVVTTAVVRMIPGSPFALVSVAAGASHMRFRDYLLGTAIGIMAPVIAMTLATEQISRLLVEPNPLHIAMLVGVIALWLAVAFGAQALLERIAKG